MKPAEFYPKVTVEDITEKPEFFEEPRISNLGDAPEARQSATKIQGLQAAIRLEANRVLRLTWTGNKIPRGVRIDNNREILWTQHGQVIAGKRDSGTGDIVGTYDRIKEFGGEGKDEQEMIVYLNE